MYNLPYFKDDNPERVRAFIDQHPFAYVSGCDAQQRPVATQLPIFLEEQNGRQILRGHLMKNTDHHRAFLQNDQVLVVFTGPHTYVSATWYTNPHSASTWNYMSVHARGRIRFLDDAALIEVLQKTSLHFEQNNPVSPTVFDNLPADQTQRMMRAIVAFEIEIEAIDHVFKLSQNRDRESYQHIIRQLREGDADARAIAAEMERREEEVFKNL